MIKEFIKKIKETAKFGCTREEADLALYNTIMQMPRAQRRRAIKKLKEKIGRRK